MIKNLLLAATATVAIAASTGASAATIYVIDDFLSAPPNPFSAQIVTAGSSKTDGPDPYTIGGIGYTRSVLFEMVTPYAGGFAKIDIKNGDLKIVNAPGVRSRTTLTYDISALDALIPDSSSIQLGVSFSNGLNTLNGPTTIEAYLSHGSTVSSLGQMILSQRIDGSTAFPEIWSNLQLLGSQLTGTGDILSFIINGPADYDLTLDQIQAQVGSNTSTDAVPEPAMIGLFGLGALGLGIARRRKR